MIYHQGDLMNRHEFEISRFIVIPSRKVYGIYIKVKAEPSILRELATLAEKNNITILYLTFSTPQYPNEPIKAISFLDFTNAATDIHNIISEVSKMDFVYETKLIEPIKDGFIVDTLSLPLTLDGERAMIIRQEGFKALLDKILELGPSGEAILYHVGFNLGLGYAKTHARLEKILGIDTPSDILEYIIKPLFKAVGFGEIKIISIDPEVPELTVRVYSNFECELAPRSDKSASNFIRGIIAGVPSGLFGVTITAEETKCIARGDDYCEFYVYKEQS